MNYLIIVVIERLFILHLPTTTIPLLLTPIFLLPILIFTFKIKVLKGYKLKIMYIRLTLLTASL